MAKREKKQSGGAPAWMFSFADLQQLLLVFFILLFSTSTTDSAKLQEVLSTFTGSKHILEKFTGDKVIEFDKKEQGKSDTVAEGEKDYDSRSNSEKKLDLLQKEVNQQQLSEDITLEDLLKAFQNYLKRQQIKKPITTKITTKEISVEERTISIKNILKTRKKVEFFDLFEDISKPYVVVTFLSILEMAKNNELKITQENNFDKIYCEVA